MEMLVTIEYSFEEIGKAMAANELLKGKQLVVSLSMNQLRKDIGTLVHRIALRSAENACAAEGILTPFGLMGTVRR
jgi:hypothetical protein